MIIIIEALVENTYFIFIGTIASIIGLLFTLIVAFKTKSISKQLNEMRAKQEYYKNQNRYALRFNTYTKNLLDDKIGRPSFYKEILKDVAECQTQFNDLFSLKDKILIKRLLFHLKKESDHINVNKLSNDLNCLAARLTKKEDNLL